MLAITVGGDDHRNPPATFDEDESTVMVPTFSDGSFFADRYRIDRLLGSGAMGRVYAATELHSGRQVALKVLHKERLGEAETVARFKREAEVLASIGHPCIVEIFTFHHTPDGTPYLAMELLEGVTLKTRLHSGGRFEDPRQLQEVVDGISGALDAAHSRGVVHRDMKPDNIFLLATGEPRAKLVDFGLSRIAKADKSLTHSGMILGTPRYMAPEQIRDAAKAGPSVDIYSLGIIVYESLTGQSPYPAQDYGQLLGCVMEGRTTPLEQVRPELAHIAPVVARAVHPDPSQRFQSCGELADAYGAALGVPSKRHEIVARHTPAPARRKRIPSAASIPVNKGSTLAFDVAALGGRLPDLPRAVPAEPEEPLAPPPPVWDLEPTDPNTPSFPGASSAGHSSPGHASPGHSSPGYASPGPAAPIPATSIPATMSPAVSRPGAPRPGASSPGAPSPGAWGPATPSPGAQGGSAPPAHLPMSGPPPPAPPFGGVETTEPMRDPRSSSPDDFATKSQGGDTMFLPNAGSLSAPAPPMPSPAAPSGGWGGASPAPRASYAPSGAPPSFQSSAGAVPAPKKKRKGCGVVLFLVAMVVVVVVSAAGGLALRAYTRGELELPFDIPGLEPAEPPADATGDS